jgi:Autotransporter beta-domain
MMNIRCIAGLAAISLAQPAWAEGEQRPWSISLSGGTTSLENRGDQPFASLSLTRNIGDGYVSLTTTHVDSRDGEGLLGAVPAKTNMVSLGGGIGLGAISLDGYASIGWRRFGGESFQRRTGQSITVTSNGNTAAIGASVTYDAPLGDHVLISPFISVDYSRVDTARAIIGPVVGLIARTEKQDGVTGALGTTATYMFGPDHAHSVGGYAAFVTSSNTTSYNRGTSPIAAARVLGALDVPGMKDSWGEYGATASFRLAQPLRLDLSVIRTVGFVGCESTSGSVGLRFSF